MASAHNGTIPRGTGARRDVATPEWAAWSTATVDDVAARELDRSAAMDVIDGNRFARVARAMSSADRARFMAAFKDARPAWHDGYVPEAIATLEAAAAAGRSPDDATAAERMRSEHVAHPYWRLIPGCWLALRWARGAAPAWEDVRALLDAATVASPARARGSLLPDVRGEAARMAAMLKAVVALVDAGRLDQAMERLDDAADVLYDLRETDEHLPAAGAFDTARDYLKRAPQGG